MTAAPSFRTAVALVGGPTERQRRIEACDTCGLYQKRIDDPTAIFEVDDLASVPLDIWATENGYHKPAPNLFGL